MVQIEFRAMNCQMMAVIDTTDRQKSIATALLAQVPKWFEVWEQRFSRFRSDSELTLFNQQSSTWVEVSSEFFEVIEAARWAAVYSDGLVSPLVLNALESVGYDRTFEQIYENSAQQVDRATATLPDWRNVMVDAIHKRVYVPAGLRLDFGGIVKGWCAEQAVKRLSNWGPALVDAGGDVAMRGKRSEPWPIAIANPLQMNDDVDLLMIQEGSVATSGRDYRRWRRGGMWQHHIVDPRTSQPAITDVLSATVVAPRMLQAESAAKTVLIQGSRVGMQWVEAHPELAALLVLENGSILRSRHMVDYLWQDVEES